MTKEQILQNVNFDIDKAKSIYEWLNAGETSKEPITANHDAIIEAYHSEKYDGVRVQALGEDFVISLHDLDDGKDNFKYDDAMIRLEELNLYTFNRKQAAIICIYLDQINDKLIEAGGEAFTEDWYITNELYIPRGSSADYNSTTSWSFHGMHGSIHTDRRHLTAFHSRPAIDLPVPLHSRFGGWSK